MWFVLSVSLLYFFFFNAAAPTELYPLPLHAALPTLDLNNTTLPGSVLAPNAHLTITGGGINGQTIANSATQIGGGQFNNYTFGGSLPPTGGSGSGTGGATPAVPSPAAVWGGLGLIGSMLLRRRRRG